MYFFKRIMNEQDRFFLFFLSFCKFDKRKFEKRKENLTTSGKVNNFFFQARVRQLQIACQLKLYLKTIGMDAHCLLVYWNSFRMQIFHFVINEFSFELSEAHNFNRHWSRGGL